MLACVGLHPAAGGVLHPRDLVAVHLGVAELVVADGARRVGHVGGDLVGPALADGRGGERARQQVDDAHVATEPVAGRPVGEQGGLGVGHEVVEERGRARLARAEHHLDGLVGQDDPAPEVVGDLRVGPVADVAHEDLGHGRARQAQVVHLAPRPVLDVVHDGHGAGDVGHVLEAPRHARLAADAERGELGLGAREVGRAVGEEAQALGRARLGVVDVEAAGRGLGGPQVHGEPDVARSAAVDRRRRGGAPWPGRGRLRRPRRAGERGGRHEGRGREPEGEPAHVSRTAPRRRRACGDRRAPRTCARCRPPRPPGPARSRRRGRRRTGRTPGRPAACCG